MNIKFMLFGTDVRECPKCFNLMHKNNMPFHLTKCKG